MMTQYDTNKLNVEGLRLPESADMETQVLADIIGSPECIPTARGLVNESMFTTDETRHVWRTVNEMFSRGDNVDLMTVATKIDRETRDRLISNQFNMGIATEFSVTGHCYALRTLATRRTVFAKAWELLAHASDNTADYNELITLPGKLADEITQGATTTAKTQGIVSVLNDLADTLQDNQARQQSGKRTRVPTGFEFLDKLTYSGFNAGNLVILSARPSVGKTAVMLKMATTSAKAGFSACIYSLEMTNQELGQRLLFSTGKVTPKQLSSGEFDWNDVESANAQFDTLPLYLNDTARTLEDITADIILNHERGRADIAFIDYLGLIQSTNPRQSLYQAISERTARLKQVAKECGIPIVLLAQLNRNTESDNRSPELYDLRDSGSIEQDSDIVLMLERESHDLNDHNVNMWVRKNRQGRAGNVCVQLRANDSFTDFEQR